MSTGPDSAPARLDVELVLDARAELGEGPVWDAARGELLWVDIGPGAVHRFDPSTGSDSEQDVGQPIGALALRAAGGLVLAVRDGFALADADGGGMQLHAEVEADRPDLRMNDGAVDARGRFWAGTMAADESPGKGSLYRLDADGSVERTVTGVSISNGIDWSLDGSLMYYVDSLAGGIDVFDFDMDSGSLANRRRLVDVGDPAADIVPDGLCVDADGCIWVGLWEGWAVHRYSPQGELLAIVDVPVARVTSCAFGGSELDLLYVTTARPEPHQPRAAEQTNAGSIFVARPGVRGLAPAAYAG